MNLEEALKVVGQYAGQYMATFGAIMASPSHRDWPMRIYDSARTATLPREPQNSRLPENLIIFMLCSLFIGYTVASLIPGRGNKPSLPATIVVTVLFWIAYSSILYLLCRLLGGHGRYLDTLAVSLQVFSALYVVSTFLVLVLAILIGPDFYIQRNSIGGSTASLYFPIHAALLGVYLPVILTRLHGLGWPRHLLVAIPFAILLGYVGWSVHHELSIDYYPPHAPWWIWWDE